MGTILSFSEKVTRDVYPADILRYRLWYRTPAFSLNQG